MRTGALRPVFLAKCLTLRKQQRGNGGFLPRRKVQHTKKNNGRENIIGDFRGVAVPLVGGNCNNGLNCGAYVNLNNTAGNANWNIAPGHSYQIMED